MTNHDSADEPRSSDEPDLSEYYGNLKNYVRMVTGDYSNLLMLDAKGGLGKTHNVLETLHEELPEEKVVHQKGFTTPIELFKTLWKSRKEGTVLFLDDMSGITSNTKAIDMLKSATDTEGDENWVEYRTSRDISHPEVPGAALNNTFCFRGNVILSFNDTPDNRHFEALKDRGTFYNLTFTYDERIDIIKEIAKKTTFSDLSIHEQMETAEWVETVTNPTFDVTIRSFEEVCKMREFSKDTGEDWKKMALEIFNLDYEKNLILTMRKNSDMSIEEQRERYCEKTGKSESQYYNKLGEIKDERN